MRVCSATLVRATLLCLAVLAVGANAAHAEPPRWKFAAGQKLEYRLSQTATSTFNLDGIEFGTSIKQTLMTTWNVKEVTPQGEAKIDLTISTVKLSGKTPRQGGTPVELNYDSSKDQPPTEGPLASAREVLKILPQTAFAVRISAQGEVLEFSAPEEFKKLSPPLARAALFSGGNQFSEQAIRQMIELAVQPLPAQDATAPWTRQVVRELPAAGKLAFDLTYQPAAEQPTEKHLLRIAAASQAKYLPPDEENPLLKLSLEEGTGRGVVVFDQEQGQTVASAFRQQLLLDGEFGERAFTQEASLVLQVERAGAEPLTPPTEEELQQAGE